MTSPRLTGVAADFVRPIAEIWSYHEALRRLGFPADDIYVLASPTGLVVALCVARTEPPRMIGVGKLDCDVGSRDAFQAAWLDFVAKLSDGTVTDDELDAVWEASDARRNAVRMLAWLIEKGIEMPSRKHGEDLPS